jgi:hypothetical protein
MEFALGWPEVKLDSGQEYIKSSPLGQILFRLSPSHTPLVYFSIHLMAITLAFCVMFFSFKKRHGSKYGIDVLTILLLGQLGFVLFRWIGSYDAFTILCWSIIGISYAYNHPPLVYLGCTLLGFQNFEQGLIGFFVLMVAVGMKEVRSQSKFILKILISILFGKIILETIFYISTHTLSFGRINYFTFQIVQRGFLDIFTNLPFYIWTIGFFPLVFIYYGAHLKWHFPIRNISTAFIISFLSSAAAIDHTRVFTLVSFPTIFWFFNYWLPKQYNFQKVLKTSILISWIYLPGMLWGSQIVLGYGHFRQILNGKLL